MTVVAQASFTTGELAPSLAGRIDLARFYTSLKTCRNFIVRPSGGVTNRPGSVFCSATKFHLKKCRLVPFMFNSAQTYALEFGNYYMRVHSNGGNVVYPEFADTPTFDVTGVIPAVVVAFVMVTPMKLTIIGNNFQDGDTVIIRGVAVGIDGTRTIGYVDANTVSLPGLLPIDVDDWTGEGNVAANWIEGEPVEIHTIWPERDINRLSFTQSADVVTICHPDYPPQQLSRYSHHNWRLSDFKNVEGPFQELNTDASKTVHATAYSGATTISASVGIFTPEMVGQMLKIEAAPDSVTPRWEVQKEITVNAIRRAGVSYYQALNSGTTGTIRPSTLEGSEADGDPGITWLYLHSGFGIVLITGYTSETVVTGTVLLRLPNSVVNGSVSRAITNVIPGEDAHEIPGEPYPTEVAAVNAVVTCPAHGFTDGESITIAGVLGIDGINVTAQIIVNDANHFQMSGVFGTGIYVSGGFATRTLSGINTYKWAVEAWGGDQGYPATSAYYQQRQIFGGTPARLYEVQMSRSAGYLDFGQSNPLLDDDAITFSLNSGSIGQILHFVGLKQLIALTTEGPWIITKEQGNLIPVVEPQGEGGSSTVAPLKVGKQALYIEEKGGIIRALGYEFSSDTYEGKDLTISADHLFQGHTIVSWAYQKVPFRCVWMVRDDGVMIGMTYLPEQEVVGWSRHDTDGAYESVCCIPENGEDVLYAVVNRPIEGVTKRYVERFASRLFKKIEDAFFVDCGLTYDGRLAGAGVHFTLSGGVEWTYEETLTFTTAAPFFSGVSDEGDEIVVYDATGEALRLKILEYVSATVVNVLANRSVPAEFRSVERIGFQVARDAFTGLDHLEGKTVSVLADGNVEAQAVVIDGGFSLAAPCVVVHAGLPIEADFETLDINVQGQSMQDKVKNVRSVTLIVDKTRGLYAGPDADHLLEVSPRMSGQYDNPIADETGPMKANIISDWSEGGRVLVRQSDPLPATILAALPEVSVGGA